MYYKFDELKKLVLVYCQDDDTGLWFIIGTVKKYSGYSTTEEIKKITMQIISELLTDNLIIAGFPTKDGDFVSWDLSVNEIIARINSEWDMLGKEPDMGDIVWFASKD